MENNKEQSLKHLLNKMTIEEKIGQLNQIGTSIYGGKEHCYEQLVRDSSVGSFLSIKDIKQANKLQEIAVTETRLKIPLLFAEDVVHGFSTIFPIPLAESCSWNKNLMTKTAEIAAKEASAEGIHWTFAPMVDVSRDPRWGRVAESFGEDPFLTSEFGAAKITGFQGNLNEGKVDKYHLISCAKHFVGYSESEAGRDYNTVDISDYKLANVYLPPFKRLIDDGVLSIMSAFNSLNGIPSTLNQKFLITFLREKLEFDGLLITDWNALEETIVHGYCKDEYQAVKLAMEAKIDVDMSSRLYHSYLKKLITTGVISEELLDKSVLKVLDLKDKLGLFENPFRSNCLQSKMIKKENFKHRKLARKIAGESIVLLKNDSKILPLGKHDSIAFIGPYISDKEAMLDTWACKGTSEGIVSILDALTSNEKYLPMNHVFSDYKNAGKLSKETIDILSKMNKIVVTLGEKATESGEAKSKASIEVDPIQVNFLKEVANCNSQIIVILMNGRPMIVDNLLPYCKGLVEAWHLGSEAGNAIMDVLSGDINPSGKLTMTFPRHQGQIPLYYNHFNTGRPYSDIKFNTSKYLDTLNSPQFPFGFGLSYTTFKLSPINIEVLSSESYIVTTTVENIGNKDGYETVQVYRGAQYGRYIRPVKELIAYKKIFVKAQTEVSISFELSIKDLTYFDESFNEIVEDGKYWLMIGSDSIQAEKNKMEIEVSANGISK